MLERVHVVEGGTDPRMELLESLCKANCTLKVVTISSGLVLELRWTSESDSE